MVKSLEVVNPIKYFGEVRAELKNVVWPKPAVVIKLTTVVLLTSVIIGLYVGGLDFSFTKILSLVLTKK